MNRTISERLRPSRAARASISRSPDGLTRTTMVTRGSDIRLRGPYGQRHAQPLVLVALGQLGFGQ